MNQVRRRATAVVAIAALVLAAVVAMGGPGTSAQDATGSPTATRHDHPAHIHHGTCDTLGEVVYPLTNLMASDTGSTPTADTPATPTVDLRVVVAESTTTVEAALDDVLGGEHAINVHESAENISTYIACGDIAGTTTDGQLQIELRELNASGYEGQAILQDNGDGTTTVTVLLMLTDTDTMGSPEASPIA